MKLLERLHGAGRLAHFAKSTRVQYGWWVEQSVRFHRLLDGGWRPPADLRGADVGAFLTHMAVERGGAKATGCAWEGAQPVAEWETMWRA